MNPLTLSGEISEFLIFFSEGSTMYLRMGRYEEPKYWRKLSKTLKDQGFDPLKKLSKHQKLVVLKLLIAHRKPE